MSKIFVGNGELGRTAGQADIRFSKPDFRVPTQKGPFALAPWYILLEVCPAPISNRGTPSERPTQSRDIAGQ